MSGLQTVRVVHSDHDLRQLRGFGDADAVLGGRLEPDQRHSGKRDGPKRSAAAIEGGTGGATAASPPPPPQQTQLECDLRAWDARFVASKYECTVD